MCVKKGDGRSKTLEREKSEGKRAETKGRRAWWDKCTYLTIRRGPFTHTHVTHADPPTDRQSRVIVFINHFCARNIVEPTISAPADYIRASSPRIAAIFQQCEQCFRGNRDQSVLFAANLLHRVTFTSE